ncbi:MAG: FAD-dependent oxidoreductase [Clostridia bacterium]|nr:FAD-dependent oxidoreductase [Clostridia bacterium]
MYDIIIIGAGPAGLTAALYARRAEKSVLLVERSTFGGQITHSPRVENYPGYLVMSGNELAEKLLEQVMTHGAEIELDEVKSVEKIDTGYLVITENNAFEGKSVIIATGSKHRTLGLEGEEELVGEGVSYCAVCDGAFYKGKTVAIIGGGNTALQETVLLSEGCERVHVVQNLGFLTGEGSLISAIEKRDNVSVILSTVVTELVSEDGALRAIRLMNLETGEESELAVDGVFVAIGQIPENEMFSKMLELDERGYVVAGEDCLPKTGFEGVFVAGDCRTKSVRQVTTATADGAVAALAACRYVDSLK